MANRLLISMISFNTTSSCIITPEEYIWGRLGIAGHHWYLKACKITAMPHSTCGEMRAEIISALGQVISNTRFSVLDFANLLALVPNRGYRAALPGKGLLPHSKWVETMENLAFSVKVLRFSPIQLPQSSFCQAFPKPITLSEPGNVLIMELNRFRAWSGV